jgi:uncharacterized damage-inducible protein DinB
MMATQSPVIATLVVQFRMTQWILDRNLEGLTNEHGSVRAVPDGSDLAWLVRHVISVRNAVLPSLGQEAVPLDGTMPLEALVASYAVSQERLLAGLSALTDDGLSAAPPVRRGDEPETLGTLLSKIAIHEAYHLGQTGILRRIAGKEGAIR